MPTKANKAENDSAIHVAYIHPQGFLFWDAFRDFLEGVSFDLGITLSTVGVTQRGDAIHAVKKLSRSNNKPDYLIFNYQDTVGAEMIKLAHKAGISVFLLNTDVTEKDKDLVGLPRTVYSSWIGHLFQNDIDVGYILADQLIERYSQLNTAATQSNAKVLLAAVSGYGNSTASIHRNRGLTNRLKESDNIKLTRIIETKWHSHEAKRVANELLNIYPDISIFWAASDALAVGAINGINQHQRTLGKDILVGSIDWSKRGIQEVANGNISVNIGGHFMHGGWALVLIKDYHNGIDFADELGTTINLPLEAIDRTNVQQYLEVFQENRWHNIDFRHFSKYYTPSLKQYDFSLNKLFSEYEKVKK